MTTTAFGQGTVNRADNASGHRTDWRQVTLHISGTLGLVPRQVQSDRLSPMSASRLAPASTERLRRYFRRCGAVRCQSPQLSARGFPDCALSGHPEDDDWPQK